MYILYIYKMPYRLVIIDTESGHTLFVRDYRNLKRIAFDIRMPFNQVKKMYYDEIQVPQYRVVAINENQMRDFKK